MLKKPSLEICTSYLQGERTNHKTTMPVGELIIEEPFLN